MLGAEKESESCIIMATVSLGLSVAASPNTTSQAKISNEKYKTKNCDLSSNVDNLFITYLTQSELKSMQLLLSERIIL